MTLEVVKHAHSTAEEFIKLGVMAEELVAAVRVAAAASAPPGTLVEFTTLATVIEIVGRSARFHLIADENFAQAVGMGVGSAMMKRGGEVLNLYEAVQAFIRGFDYGANALAAMDPGPKETAQ